MVSLPDPKTFERFANSVDVDEVSGCWNWIGAIFSDSGRGVFAIKLSTGQWRRALAHRFAYEVFVGTIPAGLTLDHLCCNKICVCPEHLDPCTSAENMRRRIERQTHCRNGHPLAGDNLYTYVRPGGVVTRHCRACRREADRRHDERRKEQA